MKRIFTYVALLFLYFFISAEGTICLAAEEKEALRYQLGEVIVSASKIEEYVAETGSTVIVITKEEMEQKKYKTVLEAIQRKMGIDSASNSVFGGSTSVFLRGSDAGHMLVMMDGVRLYDPISTNATYDLANLALDNIERIEIIKGPQSSLYGSDAMAGVVNIITKKGKGKPAIFASSEVASKSTYTESIGISGSKDKLSYAIESSRQDSDGISKARDGSDKDAYQRTSFNSKFSYNVNEDLEIGMQSLYLRARIDLDDGAYEDDPNYWMKYENVLLTGFGNHKINDIWTHEVQYAWLRNIRQLFDDPDSVDTSEYYRAWFKGWTQEVNWQHNINLGKFLSLGDSIEDIVISGFQYNYEAGKEKSTYGDLARATSHNEGYFFENKFGLNDKLFNTLAVRVDDHSRFGTHTTGRGTISYLFDSHTRLKSSYGTGFNAPSLYQLFSDYGDANLNAEESWGYDCGIEHDLLDEKLSFSLVYFHSRLKDLIEFDSWKVNPNAPWGYGMFVNTGSAKTEGIETEIRYQPTDNLFLKYGFSYTKAMNLENKYHLIRRPVNKHNANVNFKFLEKFNLNFGVTRNVKIYEVFNWGEVPKRLKDYTVCDLALSYAKDNDVEIFAKVENLFDEVYQEASGYSVKPQFFHLGVKARF